MQQQQQQQKILLLLLLLLLIIHIMQGIYSYVLETNNTSRAHIAPAIL
jgi:uncharacterized protein (UPF0333 family)